MLESLTSNLKYVHIWRYYSRLRSAKQLKGQINAFAKKSNLQSQEVLQIYIFERIIDRLSKSQYSSKFIIKGGFLISSMIGISERTTMDIDTTVTGITMNENEIKHVIKEILNIDVNDGFIFIFDYIEAIREKDDYNNYRIHIIAKFGKINNPMKIDITTGDSITPAAINYSYKSILDNYTIPIMAYNLESIIAEKYETIIRRNIGSTRARDFYDLYKLYNLYKNSINYDILKLAIINTSKNRDSLDMINISSEIIEDIENDSTLISIWNTYCSSNSYITGVSYKDIIKSLREISSKL